MAQPRAGLARARVHEADIWRIMVTEKRTVTREAYLPAGRGIAFGEVGDLVTFMRTFELIIC